MTTRVAWLLVAMLAAGSGPVRAQPVVAGGTTDARIAAVQQSLQITAEQLPQWNSFAEAMRENAAATDALFRDRAANARMMNAADNMRSYAAVARSYADATQKLADAFGTLYGILSDRQKELADGLFRQQAVPAPNSSRR